MNAKATALVVLVVAAAAAFIVREQRAANDQILSTLNDVTAALTNQTHRSRELEQQVVALSDRVASLEKEVVDLRRRIVRLSRPVAEITQVTPLLETTPLVALAPLSPTLDHSGTAIVVDTLPITWSTDWGSFQPAGIISPPAPIVLRRKLSDPSFLKRLYVGYAALQVGDILSTRAGLERNGREANPLLRGVARSPAALVGVKAVTTVGTILTIERLRKQQPVVASVVLIALNATMAAVTINNVSVATREKRAKP